MTNWHRSGVLQLLKLCDLAVVVCAFALAIGVATPGGESWVDLLEARIRVRNVLFLAGYLGYCHLLLHALGLYRSQRLSASGREWRTISIAVLLIALPLWPSTKVLRFGFPMRHFLPAFAAMAAVGLGVERRLMRVLARSIRRYGHDLRRAIIVGDGDATFDMASQLARRSDLGYRVIGTVDIHGTVTPPARALRRVGAILEKQPIDEIFAALPLDRAQALIRELVTLCEDEGITLRLVSQVADPRLARAQVDEIDGQPVLSIFTGPPDSVALLVKNVVDVVLAGAALVLVSPLFVLVALAIKLDSRGPVFFVQERVGFNGRRFRFYKFRTMVADAERIQAALEARNEADGPVFKIRDDPRVTRVGRWIRKLSVDELPQLANVVLGDMSLVGPRPLPVRDVSRMDVRTYKRRMSVKPGITCLWQAGDRVPVFEEWVKTDMQYIDNWSLALDFKILAQTIPAVLSGRGAY
jgi:exopolysaccharide biosynthesis polyprenyl glycosylphosphotransferase